MESQITREAAWELLRKYNKDSFHIQHALTVEAVMKWYANELGYGDQAEYWGIVGLLHDIDFEQWPEQHCEKTREIMEGRGRKEAPAGERHGGGPGQAHRHRPRGLQQHPGQPGAGPPRGDHSL